MSSIYTDVEKYICEIEDEIDSIYEKILHKPGDKSSISSFNKITKYCIDINKTLLPISKSLQGDILLTSSKIWMTIILIKVSQSNKKQTDFLTLINASLTHLLNDYIEYRKFFEKQCEILFDDKLAISQINANPKFQGTLKKNADHEDVKKCYIYLLLQAGKFKDIEEDLSMTKKRSKLDQSQEIYSGLKKTKEMKIFEEILENNEMIKKYSATKENVNKKLNLNDKTVSSDGEDEVNDRLNEQDMIVKKKIQNKTPINTQKKNINNLNKNKKKEKKEEVNEENKSKLKKNKKNSKKKNKNEYKDKKYDKDLEEIDEILNKTSRKLNKKNIKNKIIKEDSTKLSAKYEESENEQKKYPNKKRINNIRKISPSKKKVIKNKKSNDKKNKIIKKEKSAKKNKTSSKTKKSKDRKYSQTSSDEESISDEENSEFSDEDFNNDEISSLDDEMKNEIKKYEKECEVNGDEDLIEALEGNDLFLDDLLSEDKKSQSIKLQTSEFSSQKENGEPVLDLEDDELSIFNK